MKKITLFLLSFLTLATMANAQIFSGKKKKDVTGQTVVLTRHPDEVKLVGADQKTYFLFFNLENKCLFFTDKQEVYISISTFLPEKKIPGRSVEIDGPSINPLTFFSKKQLDAKSKEFGFGINRFNTFRLMNYSLVEPDTIPATNTEKRNWGGGT
jgi:hypothetical protein